MVAERGHGLEILEEGVEIGDLSLAVVLPGVRDDILVLNNGDQEGLLTKLHSLRELAYARWTGDGMPRKIRRVGSFDSSSTRLLVRLINPTEYSMRPLPENLAGHGVDLENLATIGAYFRLEMEGGNGNQHRIEARDLLRWPHWPQGRKIGYFSEFSPYPLLAREPQQCILTGLLHRGFEIAEQEGFADEMFVIMNDKVAEFVREAGIRLAHQPGAELNRDNPEAREVFAQFPRYWQTAQLYRFVAGSNMGLQNGTG